MVNKTINHAGLHIIEWDECNGGRPNLKAYLCPAHIWTIGFGHTGPDVHPGMVITAEQAETLLRGDLAETEGCLNHWIKTATDNQFSAMVSLAFNIGVGNFRKSDVLQYHNVGHYAAAQEAFAGYDKGAGKVLPGLVTRRAQEAKLYGTPDT